MAKTIPELNEMGRVIIGSAFDVRNNLGSKFVEEIYQEAMMIELESRGLHVEGQHSFDVFYKGRKLNFRPKCDIIVEDEIIIELKAVPFLKYEHVGQLISYLTAADKRLGYLINFQAPEFRVAHGTDSYRMNLGIYRFVNGF